MKKLALVLLMLCGCGGAASTALDRVADDAGRAEAAVDAGPGVEAAIDAGSVEAAAGDTSSVVTDDSGQGSVDSGSVAVDSGAVDSAPTCTPFDGGTIEFNILTNAGATVCSVQVPSQFLVDPAAGCGPEPMPAACQCVETYTCACIGNPIGCGGILGCGIEHGVVAVSCN